MLIENGAILKQEILKEICLQGDVRIAKILLKCCLTNESSLNGLQLLDENKNTYLYLCVIKHNNNDIDLIKIFFSQFKLQINIFDLVNLYDELTKILTLNSKNNNNNVKFDHYLECLIIFLKYDCFNFNLKTIKHELFSSFNCFMLNLLKLILKIKADINSKIYYLFALSIYSRKLNCHDKQVKDWLFSINNKTIEQLCLASTSQPWSLAQLCRIVINNRNFKTNNNIPKICLKYLEYDYF